MLMLMLTVSITQGRKRHYRFTNYDDDVEAKRFSSYTSHIDLYLRWRFSIKKIKIFTASHIAQRTLA